MLATLFAEIRCPEHQAAVRHWLPAIPRDRRRVPPAARIPCPLRPVARSETDPAAHAPVPPGRHRSESIRLPSCSRLRGSLPTSIDPRRNESLRPSRRGEIAWASYPEFRPHFLRTGLRPVIPLPRLP